MEPLGSAPLRVLYSFPHPIGTSGINNTAWQQVKGLHDAGIRVILYCTSVARQLPAGVELHQTLAVAGRRIPHRALGRRGAYEYHDRRVAMALRRLRGEIDVVHCWPGSCHHTVAAARRLGIATFREAPNAHTAQTFEDAERAVRDAGVPLPEHHSHRYRDARLSREESEFAEVDFLLAPSPYVEESFLARGTASWRLLRHRYGYDPAAFPSPGPRDASRPFTAAFVGRGDPTKGLHLALDAWLRSDASHRGQLLICGNVQGTYAAALRERLEHPSVIVLGFVKDVGSVLARSDVLLLPSYTEGSALVTYEAQGSGAVPLVSNATGAAVTHELNGLLHDTGDVTTLAGQLNHLLEQPEVLARMRSAALENSRLLTWQEAGRVLAGAYRDGVARYGAKRKQQDNRET